MTAVLGAFVGCIQAFKKKNNNNNNNFLVQNGALVFFNLKVFTADS